LADGSHPGWKRRALFDAGAGALFAFVNSELLLHLRNLASSPLASPKQKIIGEIMSAVERVSVGTESNFLDVLDMVNQISTVQIDTTHIFTLSQVNEELLVKMGEKNSDGGQFFTPREVIRAMVKPSIPSRVSACMIPAAVRVGF
jgi:type I restriction enzyme M protein